MESEEECINENVTGNTKIKITKFNQQQCEIKDNSLMRQIGGTSAMAWLCISGSMVAGFSGILLPQLQEPNSIIKLNSDEESWIAAMAPLQMSLGCVFSSWSMDKFGRKMSNIVCAILAVIGWGIIYYSQSVTTLLIGRVVCGLYVGLSGMSVAAYIAEISDTKYRSVFLSFVALGIAGGVFIEHLLGTFFTWQMTALITMILPIILFFVLIYLPESHVWYINQNKLDEARKSFQWYRGHGIAATEEFDLMIKNNSGSKKSLNEILLECKKQEFYNPLMILFLFFITVQVTGTNVVTFYSVQLMQITVPTLDRYAAMLIIDTMRLIASIVACALTKRYKVRPLLFTSAIGTITSLFALSIFVYMGQLHPDNKVYTTIPLGFLITYIIFVSIGLVPLPWTVCGEILPPVTKGVGGGIACAINFMAFFIVVKTNPYLFETLGTHGTFGLYGVLVTAGTIGLYFVLPETKNRTLQEIQDSFKPRVSILNVNCDSSFNIKQ